MLKVTQFRVGVVQLGARLDVTRVDDGNGPKQKLHVPLRHRVPLQAEVGEGAVAVPVDSEPCHFAVADLEQSRAFRTQGTRLGAAYLAAPAGAGEDQNPLVVELAKLVGDHSVLVKQPQPVAPSLGYFLRSDPAPGIGPVCPYELDLPVNPVGPAEVACSQSA
jgi:hypothetical protein